MPGTSSVTESRTTGGRNSGLTPRTKKTINRADVEEIRDSQLSIMPDNQLGQITETETRNLLACCSLF